ncbi:2-acylglycerol O-acyltransferase [Bertholletia excelsa]
MARPIHEANENSPYGDLTREEFYKRHKIINKESFMVNNQNTKIFTQCWCPDSTTSPSLRGIVAMVHGYNSETSWLFELTAVAIAKAGFYVCALDLQGHGYSDGLPGHIPCMDLVVQDCIQFFDIIRANHPNLPAFLFGESLGGAIAVLICLKQANEWSGMVVRGAMCEVSAKAKPVWPLEELLPLAAYFAPTWKIVITKSPAGKSYKEELKRKLVLKSPNRPKSGKPTMATALEFLRVCEHIQRNCQKLQVPMLVVHGGDDRVCEPNSAKLVYHRSASKDKTLKVFEGMWHQFIGEPNEIVDVVFGTMLSWICERAGRARTNCVSLT